MEKFLRKIIWLIIITPVIYLAFVWNSLPESIALHFNIKGNIDRYGSKNELLFMVIVLIAINIVVYLLLPNIYRIDPKKYARENKDKLYRISYAVVVFLTGVICLIIYSMIHENIDFSIRLILSGVGLLLAVIGNYMHTIKPNYFAGFRLPWTLNNDENWKKTHLLGGKLFFGGGLLIAVTSLFASYIVSMVILFTIITIITLITCFYSYRLYKNQKTQI